MLPGGSSGLPASGERAWAERVELEGTRGGLVVGRCWRRDTAERDPAAGSDKAWRLLPAAAPASCRPPRTKQPIMNKAADVSGSRAVVLTSSCLALGLPSPSHPLAAPRTTPASLLSLTAPKSSSRVAAATCLSAAPALPLRASSRARPALLPLPPLPRNRRTKRKELHNKAAQATPQNPPLPLLRLLQHLARFHRQAQRQACLLRQQRF